MHKICGIFIYRKCKETEKSYIFRYDDIWMHPPSPSNPTHTLFLRHEVHIRSSQIDINVNNPKYLHNPDNQRSSQNFFLIYKCTTCVDSMQVHGKITCFLREITLKLSMVNILNVQVYITQQGLNT